MPGRFKIFASQFKNTLNDRREFIGKRRLSRTDFLETKEQVV